VDFKRAEMVKGWASRHYLEKEEIQVLEIEMTEECILNTRFVWS
jgi:hypothetical protein